MENNWLKPAVGAAVVLVALLGYWLLSDNYPSVVLGAETYEHVEVTVVNEVENHFFTVDGVDVDDSDRFLQISKYDHPDLTPDRVRLVQSQVIRSFGLQPLEGHQDQFFGVFRGTVPVYGYMGPKAFVIQVGPRSADRDEAALDAATKTAALTKVDVNL